MYRTVKAVKVLFLLAVIVMAFAASNSSAQEPHRRVNPWKNGDKFYIAYSMTVEYPATETANFSIDKLRKENRNIFSYFDKKINDANFPDTIKPGDKKIIYIVRAVKNEKPFTSCEVENYLSSQNGQEASISWLLIAYSQRWKEVKANRIFEQNTVCLSSANIENKKGYTLSPYIGYDGSVALAVKDYPFEATDFIFMDDVPDVVAEK
jgi:hypothetical protein